MNKFLIVSIVGLFLGSIAGQAQTIAPASKRENLLDGMKATLGNVDQATTDYQKMESPFVVRNKQRKSATSLVENIKVETVVAAQRLPDKVALRVIGDRFNPIGSLILGNRGVLQLANGEYLETGQTFPARIQGNTYEVKVSQVSSSGYTLTLGEASIRKNFITTNGATQ